MMRLRAFVDPTAPVGDFCMESLLEKTSIFAHLLCCFGYTLRRLLHVEFLEKTSFIAIPAAPLGDFCTESFFRKRL
jgi:hypothetical protein